MEAHKAEHVKVKGKKHGKTVVRDRVMLQRKLRVGRMQVGEEQPPQTFRHLRGAQHPEQDLSRMAERNIVETVKAFVQAKVASPEASGARHQLQCGVHVPADEKGADRGIGTVCRLQVPAGEHPATDMVAKHRLHAQLRPVFPLEQGVPGVEDRMDAAGCQQDALHSGVANLRVLVAELLDLPGMIEDRQGKRGGITKSRMEEGRLFVTENGHARVQERGVNDGGILQAHPSGKVASRAVGVGAARQEEEKPVGIFKAERFLCRRGKPVALQSVP